MEKRGPGEMTRETKRPHRKIRIRRQARETETQHEGRPKNAQKKKGKSHRGGQKHQATMETTVWEGQGSHKLLRTKKEGNHSLGGKETNMTKSLRTNRSQSKEGGTDVCGRKKHGETDNQKKR